LDYYTIIRDHGKWQHNFLYALTKLRLKPTSSIRFIPGPATCVAGLALSFVSQGFASRNRSTPTFFFNLKQIIDEHEGASQILQKAIAAAEPDSAVGLSWVEGLAAAGGCAR
jgi:hypothetical protein